MKARVDLVLDCADPATLATFWREALDSREYFTDSSVSVLVPKEGVAPPLVLQGVLEPRTAKNHMSRASVTRTGSGWRIPSTVTREGARP